MRINANKNVFVGTLTAILTFSPAAALAAPAVPTPGDTLPTPAEQGRANLENDTPLTKDTATEGARFTLSNIRVEHEGMDLIDEDMAAITAPLLHHEITARELNDKVAELTRYAREKGYPAAIAYIPEQTAVEGNLLVKFEPGRFGEIRLAEGPLKERVAKRPIAGLKSGHIIRSDKLEESLRNLRDIPGVEANAVLSPGANQGESDLTVAVQPQKSANYVLYAENYGSSAAGRYRYGFQADWKNLGGTGSRLLLGALISNSNQRGGNIAFETTVGHSMTTLGIGYSHSDYELGGTLSQLGMEGKSDTLSLYGKTPLRNRYASNVNLVYGFNYRKLKDELNGMDFGDRHSQSFNIGVEGTERTAKNILRYNAAFHAGKLDTDSNIAKALAERQQTKGSFTKGTLDVTAVQELGGQFDVMLKLSGQLAGSNLDSSEHIYLGGARGVRAYPQGEASGDEGLLGTLELRYHTKLPGLTASLYYDAGCVHTVKNADGSQRLAGWGLGLTYSKPDDWFARFDYARRIGFADGLSSDAQSRGRMWFILGKLF